MIAKLKNYQVLLLGLNYKKKRKKKMGKRERDVHARAPGEDLVFVAGDLEASAVLFEADHCNVGKPLLPYRLHQRPRHDSLFLRRWTRFFLFFGLGFWLIRDCFYNILENRGKIQNHFILNFGLMLPIPNFYFYYLY